MVGRPLGVDGIGALAAAGMTVGFHTLEHPLLPDLDNDRLAAALTTGREELAAATGRPLTLLAYPHGKADQRVAGAARAAGYAAAWTGWPRPAQPSLVAAEARATAAMCQRRGSPHPRDLCG